MGNVRRRRHSSKWLERILIVLALVCLMVALACLSAAWNRNREIAKATGYYTQIASLMPEDSPQSQSAIPSEPEVKREETGFDHAPSTVVAWIRSPGTPIDYPIGQAADNTYYLRHLLDGTYNRVGAIFMDYRNHSDLSDDNTILYGHHFDDTDIMFATLIQYMDQNYYEQHPQMELLTPRADYVIHVVAGFAANADTKLPLRFGENTGDRQQFIDDILQNSDFTADDVPIGQTDRFVTLVTCTNGGASRYLLFGVLEKTGEIEAARKENTS